MKIKYLNYTWNDFEKDCTHLTEILDGIKEPMYFVGIHRGGLPLAVKLSNHYNSKMGILKYQSYGEGADKLFSFTDFYPDLGDIIVIVDDIVDTGKTFNIISEQLKMIEKYNFEAVYISIYRHQNYVSSNEIKLYSCREKCNEWVVFPWENIKSPIKPIEIQE